ncbi:MAG TPA: phosphotransferase [Candidatus Limnocylindrales bacterium]|nr:phosphotransferase [Candidatus Limnocylindrales bacterium]
MNGSWQDRSLLDLLHGFGLDLLPEHEFPTDGWSGATFTTVADSEGRRYVLKRTSLGLDWIARATRDERLREGWLAAVPQGALAWMPDSMVPYLGAAADGDGVAIVMPDLSNELIAWERPGHDPAIDRVTLARVVRAIARLHAIPWTLVLEGALERDGDEAPPWCPLPERLTLLSPTSAARYAAEDNPVGDRFLEGWALFDGRAPDAARDLVARLDADISPLVAALGRLPGRGLHGDLKLANVALLSDERVSYIDWQMTLVAPVAVDLGWFLVSNSGSLPLPPKEIVEGYREALAWDSGRWSAGEQGHDFDDLVGDWEVQRDLTWIVGLLLRGWRKGIDADAGMTLPSGVSAADDLAWWCDRAVEAAERRL